MKIMPGFAVFLLQILTNMPPLTNVPHLPSVRCFFFSFCAVGIALVLLLCISITTFVFFTGAAI